MSSISSPITTRPALLQYTRDFVQPPSQYYVTPEDCLYARVTSSIPDEPFAVVGRILTPDGEIRRFDFRGVNYPIPRFPYLFTWPLPEGCLLGLGARSTGTTDCVGQTFIELGLLRGGEDLTALSTPLCSSYVTPTARLGWPPGRLRVPEEGPGNCYVFNGTTPGMGNQFEETVPLGAQWRVKEVAWRLVCGAGVANRYCTVHYMWAGGSTMFSGNNIVQTAGQTRYYTFWEGGHPFPAYTSGYMGKLPMAGILKQGWRIRSGVVNLLAGDQLDLLVVKVEEWLSFV